MAKQKRYPRKLRLKLEKIATGRESRQEAQRAVFDAGPNPFDPSNTFYRSFFPRSSVTLLGARIDEVHQHLTLQAHMRPPLQHERISIAAPWMKRETDVSS